MKRWGVAECYATFFLISLLTIPAQAGPGCCSSHGGEDGCAGGRQLCNDGIVSPSCGCHSSNASKNAKKAIQNARDYLNVPYHLGGADKSGIDCSGLTQQAYPDYFASMGTSPEGESRAKSQLNFLEKNGDESIAPDSLQPGDLVYLKSQKNSNDYHAAIVETVDQQADRPFGIIVASSGKSRRKVMRQFLGTDGSLGSDLRYAGGGRPQ